MATIKSPWVGAARGKMGEGVYYRRDGKQCARAAAITVKNPNSNGQLITRAIMATVMQAYAAGKAIFDHSFEGKKVSAGSQARFMKVNINKLREFVANDLTNEVEVSAQKGIVVTRGAVTPVAGLYTISEGSLLQNLFSIDVDDNNQNMMLVKLPTAISATTLAEYCGENNLMAGDIFTIVGFGVLRASGWTSESATTDHQYATQFGFCRFTVKESALNSQTMIRDATYKDLFDADVTGTPIPADTLLTASINLSMVIPTAMTGTIGVIKSREDSGLRSTSEMVGPASMLWGVKSQYLTNVWNPENEKLGDSNLILEGGNF